MKVQDKADSNDMIKRPDAADLKETGRFYLQVGYNELFAMGQAAWAGAKYYPTEKRKKKVDQSISIIDNVGNIVKSLDTKKDDVKIEAKGEEITSIIQYIVDEAKKEKIEIEQLWLDKIPDVILVEELKKKYNYEIKKNVINPVIGEYDDPDNQQQNLLTLPISTDGNAIVFGSGGSGKELMLQSIVYSTITTHDSSEVNFYILDFGAETLTVFRKAPHVGEVLLATDNEKIENLFKMVTKIIEDRKKLFVDYNGSYDFYINHGGKQIPLIIVMINNVEAFLETYSDYEEILGQITRDCLKYGVCFIFSTNGPNTVRYRIRQNFRQNVVLQFNDPSDYASVLPGVRKKEPSKVYGRGMIDLGGIYEFQTAYPYKEEKMTDYIKVICNKLSDICSTKAKKVPILPEVVNLEEVESALGSMRTIPVGIEKDSLEVATVNLKDAYIYNITGEDVTSLPGFLHGVAKAVTKVQNTQCIILDALSALSTESINDEGIFYDSGKCDTMIAKLTEIVEAKKVNNTPDEVVCMIIGMNSLFQKMSSIEKGNLTMLIQNSANLGTLKFITVDTIDNIKSISYEVWYKSNIDLSQGIWIGNGIANQFTLKVTTNARILRAEIDPKFGYIIKKGKATLIKLISNE